MDITGMLHLIAAEPTLLPPAPDDADGDAIEARRREAHPCLRCGAPATVAVIASFAQHGPRWLDLCHEDFSHVRRSA